VIDNEGLMVGAQGIEPWTVELFLGDMGSIQRELRPSIQREDQLTMETKLEQIAVKARREHPVARDVNLSRANHNP
jgi:hypothetical protein